MFCYLSGSKIRMTFSVVDYSNFFTQGETFALCLQVSTLVAQATGSGARLKLRLITIFSSIIINAVLSFSLAVAASQEQHAERHARASFPTGCLFGADIEQLADLLQNIVFANSDILKLCFRTLLLLQYI